MSDKNLKELYDFICGKSWPFGSDGITTHPNRDENQQKLHLALLELEKSKQVKRHLEKEDYVVWIPQ